MASTVLLTFGLALVLEGAMGEIWGNNSTAVRPSYADESFTIGGLFGWFYIFPPTFEMLMDFAGELPGGAVNIRPTLMMSEYVSFIAQMLMVFGVTFEVPVVITFLSVIGVVNHKQLLGFGRWWLVVSAIIAAILTPTQDALSMLLLLVPLVGLYYVSVVIAYFIDLRRGRRETAEAGA